VRSVGISVRPVETVALRRGSKGARAISSESVLVAVVMRWRRTSKLAARAWATADSRVRASGRAEGGEDSEADGIAASAEVKFP